MPKLLDDLLRSLHLYEPLVDGKHALMRRLPSGRRKQVALRRLYGMFMSPGDIVFDVGANVGDMTHLFVSLETRVVCVEPQASCLKVLYRRFGSDPSIVIVDCAAGDFVGQADLYISTARPLASLSVEWIEAVRRSSRFGYQRWISTDTVQVRTLDSLIAQYGVPQFIKIDVEGFEYQVLTGLHSEIPGCSFEYTPERIDSTLQCIAYLGNLGLRWFNYAPSADSQLASPNWLSAGEIQSTMLALSDTALSGDIYAVVSPPAVVQ